MRLLLLTLVTTSLLGSAGCGGGTGDSRGSTETPELIQGPITSQGAITSGFEGVAMATVPDSLPGSIQFNREALEGAEIAIVIRGTSDEVAVVFTDANGRFSLELPPGDYALIPREKNVDGQVFRARSQILPLVPGRVTKISVEYEPVIL